MAVCMKKYFLLLLFAAIMLGIIFPLGRHVKPSIPYLLATLMFFNFYHMKFAAQHFFQRGVPIYCLLVLFVFPWLIFTATKTFPAPFRIGMFLSAISPAAISGPVIVGLIRGSREIAVTNVVIFNLLAPFSYPILMKSYFQTNDLTIPFWPLISKLLMLVFLPFILSCLAKRSQGLNGLIQGFSGSSHAILLLIIYIAISSSSVSLRHIPARDLALLTITIVLLAGSFYLSGYLSGRGLDMKKALGSTLGHKNCSLCIWLALANFDPLAAIPPTVYMITQHLFNTLLICYFNRERSRVT
ncbi:hypothetical protein CSB45_04455 [candidate division KSB3 bacterium]|uniref:Bile acid:sodium symporter n=1 Tax=candidate division KSB3 bacterium TaxID=2044937 RepID=A0A2G6E8F6_9BACT|nr:MAG: hypothetical protein CSB45_04455 [candidate division KSB3 bacterium]PIE30629.1 MAG: hypothetical protein CSA57_03040 [candidate division KSB3 bacterium]